MQLIMCTYTDTLTHIHSHTNATYHVYIHRYAHTHTLTHIHSHTYTHTHTLTYKCNLPCVHTQIQKHNVRISKASPALFIIFFTLRRFFCKMPAVPALFRNSKRNLFCLVINIAYIHLHFYIPDMQIQRTSVH